MTNLNSVLASYKIKVKIVSFAVNEVADIFWVTSTAKLSQIKALEEDLAYKMGYELVRVYPDPVKRAIVIEAHRLQDKSIKRNEEKLSEFTNYKTVLGISPIEPIVHDFMKDPHLLVAGTTGSGKSTMLHNIVFHLLKYNSNIHIIPIDFKGTELDIYEKFVPEPFKYNKGEFGAYDLYVSHILKEIVRLMEVRYEIFSVNKYKDILEYNEKETDKMSRVFVVIDELADLMLRSKKKAEEVETSIVLLVQKARAAGIHLIISTQRPTTDVLTGHIKANIPTRVALRTSTALESRIIIDEGGAENLKVGSLIYLNTSGLITGKSFYFRKSEVEEKISTINTSYDPTFTLYIRNKDEQVYSEVAQLDYGGGPLSERALEFLNIAGGRMNAWDLLLKVLEGKDPYAYTFPMMCTLRYLVTIKKIKVNGDIYKKYFLKSDLESIIVELADTLEDEVFTEDNIKLDKIAKTVLFLKGIQNALKMKNSENTAS